ncbi:hypothetical protein JCM8097_003683 [Rhodosporidiobolus ruineniae]
MLSLFRRSQDVPSTAAPGAVEKPSPAHHHPHDPRTSIGTHTTAVNMGQTAGAGGAPVGDQSVAGGGRGRAWVYQRPKFGQWLKMYWVDLLTMAALGAVGLGIYEADPAPTRNFPITFSDGEIVYPEFSYPLRHNIIPIYAAALLAFFVPFVIFCVVQIRVRSFEDLNTATFGVLYSLINAAVFQVFIKWLIGGLRPHFLAVCNPQIDASMIGTGFQSIMFTRDVCTGDRDEINDSLESMPSGHSTAAWAGFLFLSLYLNGKLKVFADYRPQFWKMIAFFAPLLGAFLISASLTIDEYHNWYDCAVGACIGSLSAIAAYRISYAAIWDFRFNHLPLPRTPPMTGHRHHTSSIYSAPRFPYETSLVSGHAAGGVGAWAGQWRGEQFGGVQGAPGDAVKGGAASGGHGAGYGGAGAAAMV